LGSAKTGITGKFYIGHKEGATVSFSSAKPARMQTKVREKMRDHAAGKPRRRRSGKARCFGSGVRPPLVPARQGPPAACNENRGL